MNVIVEICLDVWYNILYFVKNNLVNIANIFNYVLPYAMFYIGQDVALREGKYSIFNPEIAIIPLFVFTLVFFVKSIANKIGKGITVPIPEKRFTEVDEDGEVTVETGRIQEMILYMADLEDWIDRKGLGK